MTEKKNMKWVKGLGDAVNLGTTIAAAVAIGYFAGRWLDGKFDTYPWITIVGFIMGVATGMKAMWDKTVSRSPKKPKPYERSSEDKDES